MLRSGTLRERITLRELATSKSSSGGIQRDWITVKENVPARRLDFSGNEKPASAQAGGEVAVARTEFLIRWMPGVKPTMSLLHEGEVHNIRHVKPMGRRESLILTCETGVNNG